MHDLRKPVTLLALLLIVTGIIYFWPNVVNGPILKEDTIAGTDPYENFIPGPPPPEIVEMLEKSRGFEALISYTERGFEPSQVVLREGQSIRFTNNSMRDLWVAELGSSDAPLYPGVSDCGGSSFDTCKVLKPREFWEFTFEADGEWIFQNNLDKGQTGIVRVQVQ